MNNSRKAVFLDRDGTLIEHIPYLHDPREVQLVQDARSVLLKAIDEGFRLFLFTNQSGVGRGMFTMSDVEACNARMMELLDIPGEIFTEICVAPEIPEEDSGYRKPNPRFILEMIQKYDLQKQACWMLGDSECDVEAARKAGIQYFLLDSKMSLKMAMEGILKSAV